MEHLEKKIKSIFTIIVMCVLAILSVWNLPVFESVAKEKINENSENSVKNIVTNIENRFRENVKYHNQLVNVYGIYQKAIGHTIVGNFEYVADKKGVLHMINNYTPYDTETFLDGMEKLKTCTDEKGIPMFFVQAPNREIANEEDAIKDFNLDDETMDTITAALRNKGISVLDLREKLLTEGRSFELSDLYFHTDLHMQTDAEIWMLQQVVEYLESEYNIEIKDKKYLTDMSYFTKKSYEFLGNYGRTYGEYFVKSDMFDIYHPNFETSYNFVAVGDESAAKSGTFEDVVMNGYENSEYGKYTYWVTDYMQFMRPVYSYINNYQDDVKLLFVTDSIAYRGIAQLSLATSKITIADPRFFGETDYLKNALEEQYDAVIVIQGNFMLGVPLIM